MKCKFINLNFFFFNDILQWLVLSSNFILVKKVIIIFYILMELMIMVLNHNCLFPEYNKFKIKLITFTILVLSVMAALPLRPLPVAAQFSRVHCHSFVTLFLCNSLVFTTVLLRALHVIAACQSTTSFRDPQPTTIQPSASKTKAQSKKILSTYLMFSWGRNWNQPFKKGIAPSWIHYSRQLSASKIQAPSEKI